jgi:hypothetical protein
MPPPVTAAFSATEFRAAPSIFITGVRIASGRNGRDPPFGLAASCLDAVPPKRLPTPRSWPGRTAIVRPFSTPWGPR